MSLHLPTPRVLTVYGAGWCNDCRLARQFLDSAEIAYRYVDLEIDVSARVVLHDAGLRAIPVIVLPDGKVLVEPTTLELAAALGIAA